MQLFTKLVPLINGMDIPIIKISLEIISTILQRDEQLNDQQQRYVSHWKELRLPHAYRPRT
jgi:predicted nucleic acid-binding protein